MSIGRIYKIVNLTTDDERECYVGSTQESLAKRFSQHRRDAARGGKRLLCQKLNEVSADNFRIVLIEEFPFTNRDYLVAREEFHRVKIGARYNMNRAIVTEKQRELGRKLYEKKQRNIFMCECGSDIQQRSFKEHLTTNKHIKYINQAKAKIDEYKEQNKEKITEQIKQHYEQTKERITEYIKIEESKKQYLEQAKAEIDEYKEQNKEKIAERKKQYREYNKAKIRESKKQYREQAKAKIADPIN